MVAVKKRPASASAASASARKRQAPAAEPSADGARTDEGAGAAASKFDILKREILARSKAKTWDPATKEWRLEHVYRVERPHAQSCLCSHFPILEVCVIENGETEEQAEVGNCCVKKFMDLPSDAIFSAVRRVMKDGEKALNEPTVEFAYDHDWINDWEYRFYMDTFRKRSTSDAQQDHRERINKKIIGRMSRRCSDCEPEAASVWHLDACDLDEALEANKIDEWEHSFYMGNMGKDFVTSKQLLVKRRIESKVASSEPWAELGSAVGWPHNAKVVEDAFASGRIDEWSKDFYFDVFGKRRLSEKQLKIKERIDRRINGVDSPGKAAVPKACPSGTSASPSAFGAAPAGIDWPHDLAAAQQAARERRITDWDLTFYAGNLGKQRLSEKQLVHKVRIDAKIACGQKSPQPCAASEPPARGLAPGAAQPPALPPQAAARAVQPAGPASTWTPAARAAAHEQAPVHGATPLAAIGGGPPLRRELSAEQRARIERNRQEAFARKQLRMTLSEEDAATADKAARAA